MYFNYIYYNNYKLPTIIVITKIQYLHDFCHGVKNALFVGGHKTFVITDFCNNSIIHALITPSSAHYTNFFWSVAYGQEDVFKEEWGDSNG